MKPTRTEIQTAKDILKQAGYFGISWTKDDLLHLEPSLTEKQLENIANEIDRKHDCENGITWWTLREAIREEVTK